MRLALSLLGAIAAGAAVAGGVAGAAVQAPWAEAAGVAASTVAAGTLVGLGLLAAQPPRSLGDWPLLIVVGSMARMFASIAAALVMFFAFRPAVGPFWSAFLVASLAVLATEVAVLRGSLLHNSPASVGTQPESTRS